MAEHEAATERYCPDCGAAMHIIFPKVATPTYPVYSGIPPVIEYDCPSCARSYGWVATGTDAQHTAAQVAASEAPAVIEARVRAAVAAEYAPVVEAARAYLLPDTKPIPERMRHSAYGKLLQAMRDHDAPDRTGEGGA